ncbi:MAG: PAS domain S-box protein [Solirubrobacterales bacterium]|nr:PAS domain S-box protein [Solirubrobacterales bacterium]
MRSEAVDTLLALAPDPTIVVDRRVRVVAACDRAARLFDRPRTEIVGAPLDTVISGGVLDPEAKLYALRPDGLELPIEISVRVVEIDGETVLAVGLRDVTERRRRAATLREESERFRRLFEDGPVAMALADPDMRLDEVNDAFCELTGYGRDELTALSLADITHPDDVSISLRLAGQAFAGELPSFSVDKRYVRKNGEVVWVDVTVSSIRDEDGRPLKGLGVMRDISERREALKRAHAELERLERDRDRILEFAGEGIYHVDGRGTITFVNPAAEAMLGWPAEAMVGKPAHELLHHRRPDGSPYPRSECHLHGRSGARLESIADDVFWRADGTPMNVQYTSAPVDEPDGGMVVVFADVSERVRMEAELAESRQRAERARMQAAEDERARWARELHDETLQGLAAVHVLLSSGLRAANEADRRDRMRSAQEQVEGEMEKLRGLIADLRPPALDELGLAASVRDLAARMQAIYGIEVDIDVPAEPDGERPRPAPEVETVAYRIVQESLNNVAKHARCDWASVALRQAPGTLEVCVCDNGTGFDPEHQTGGFGLRGMRERVDLLHGRLTLRSGPDGTEVRAALPMLDGAGDQDGAAASRSPTMPHSIA